MQAPRLVATDVDGTLLGPAERVSERTVAVIERAVAAGVEFVLVTGRPPRMVLPVVAQVPAQLAVCANGALLYDVPADRVVWARAMAPELLGVLAAAVAEALPECGIAVERVGAGALDGPSFVADSGYVHAWADADRQITERSQLVTQPAVKMLVRCPGWSSADMVATLAPVVGSGVDLTYSHPRGLVEISAAGVTKATGLAAVAATLDIAPSDVVAFGDMPNDLAMLRWAGHGVAMANAHESLVETADEVTAGNLDDGVALVLERWF